MNPNLAAVYVVIDGSGSMQRMRAAVVSGFNEFIHTQRQIPNMTVVFTIAQFDSGSNGYMRYHELRHFENAKELPDLTLADYVPDGGTPLLEALHKGIDEFGQDLSAMPEHERPSKVVFLIMTDGEENASHAQYTRAALKQKIETQTQVYNWQFVYIGANVDAFAEAAGLGIPQSNASNFAPTPGGASYAAHSSSSATMDYISGNSASVDLSAMKQDAEWDDAGNQMQADLADLKDRKRKLKKATLSKP